MAKTAPKFHTTIVAVIIIIILIMYICMYVRTQHLPYPSVLSLLHSLLTACTFLTFPSAIVSLLPINMRIMNLIYYNKYTDSKNVTCLKASAKAKYRR